MALMISVILFYIITAYFAKFIAEVCIRMAINNGITGYRTLSLIGFCSQFFTAMAVFLSGCIVFRYFSKNVFFQKTINRIPATLTFLLFLLGVIIYRIGVHVPVPAFKAIDTQTQMNQALILTQMLWSLLIPAFLLVVLSGLRKSSKKHEI